jgi:hypothetical protein
MEHLRGIFVEPDGRRAVFDRIVYSKAHDIHGADATRVSYLIRNAGCALIAVSEKGTVFVMRARVVREPVLACLMHELANSRSRRVGVTNFNDEKRCWETRLLGTRAAALAFLADLALAMRSGEPISTIELQPSSDAVAPSVRDAIEFWRSGADTCTFWQGGLQENGFSGRCQEIVLHGPDRDQIHIRRLGTGYASHIREALLNNMKCGPGKLPDLRFQRAATRAYRAASERWHPIIEQVDARVFWPKIGHVRERYQRLILPISKADSRFLVCIADSTKPPWAPFA